MSDSQQPKLSRLERLKQKHNQLGEQIKLSEARAAEAARRLDTRRKIIAGALALEHAEKNPGSPFTAKLNSLIDEYVLRPYERKMFGLSPLPEQHANDSSHPKPDALKDQFPR